MGEAATTFGCGTITTLDSVLMYSAEIWSTYRLSTSSECIYFSLSAFYFRQMYCIEESICDIVETFRRHCSDSAPW